MNQKIITTDKATILCLMIPEGTRNIEVFKVKDTNVLGFEAKPTYFDHTKLPPGNWQPLGFANEVSEEVAREIMKEVEDDIHYGSGEGYYWIYPYDEDNELVTESAKEAFHSLLQANEVDPKENVYILKLVK